MTTAPLTEARAKQVAYGIAVKWSSRAGIGRCTNEIAAALLRYTTEAYEAGRKDGAAPKPDARTGSRDRATFAQGLAAAVKERDELGGSESNWREYAEKLERDLESERTARQEAERMLAEVEKG